MKINEIKEVQIEKFWIDTNTNILEKLLDGNSEHEDELPGDGELSFDQAINYGWVRGGYKIESQDTLLYLQGKNLITLKKALTRAFKTYRRPDRVYLDWDNGFEILEKNQVKDFLKEATAYHGSNHHFEEFSSDHIGSGKGYQTFGWGIYLTKQKQIAQRYRKRGTGAVYVVDMPDPNEMLDWNKSFSQQSLQVQQALLKIDYPDIRQRMVDDEQVSGYTDPYTTDTGEDIYGIVSTSVMSPIETQWSPQTHLEDKKKASIMLFRAGIMGIKYHDVESGNAQYDNYVIFDPRRITIKKKMK
jgi:hypothetical protein